MRIRPFCILMSLLSCLGCNRAEESHPKAVENTPKQIGEAPTASHEPHESPLSEPSHVITNETEYYTTGPQQGRPPDGKFPADTQVSIVKEAGSYVLVRSQSGVEAYVAADVVRQRDQSAHRVETGDSTGRNSSKKEEE